MERSFKGVWIPREIWLSDNLTIQEKVMLVEIDSLDNEETGCYASNSYFAKFFNLSNARITQLINSLVSKGFITTQFIRNGKEIKQRVIRINRPPYPEVVNKFTTYLENLTEGSKYSYEGYLENYKENNISTNNIRTIYKKFTKPSLDELKNFIKENNLNVNAEEFIDYYESNGWKVGRNSMKDWKATCRRWSRTEKKPNKPEWLDKKVEKQELTDGEKQELERILEDFK